MIEQARQSAKYVARRLCADASGMIAAVQRSATGLETRVLTYHDFCIDRADRDPVTVAREDFREQMSILAETCDVRAGGEILGFPIATDVKRTRVCITIDDGFLSGRLIAAPILSEYSLPTTFFVPTDYIGRPGFLTEADIRFLSDEGFDIGSHGCSHTSLPSLGSIEQARELVDSRRRLEDICGRSVLSFAYPYGTLRDFDPASKNALHDAGYTTAFTSQHGPITQSLDEFYLPRIKVEGHDSLSLFKKAVAGGLDNWRVVDRYLSKLQNSKKRMLRPPKAPSLFETGRESS